MRDLVKIYLDELDRFNSIGGFGVSASFIENKLKKQIERADITILNITRVENIRENCLECYVDYEFWGGK